MNERHIEIKTTADGGGALTSGPPGTYVCNWNGRLVRVTEDRQVHGVTSIEVSAARPPVMTRISENPYINIREARVLAANMGLAISE